MKLKRNLILGSNIFAAGTPIEAVPENVRAQVQPTELEGEPDAAPPASSALPPLRRLKLEQLLTLAAQRGLAVTDDMTRLQVIELLEAQG